MATFDFVERIVRLVAFVNVASTLMLVWTGLYTLCLHSIQSERNYSVHLRMQHVKYVTHATEYFPMTNAIGMDLEGGLKPFSPQMKLSPQRIFVRFTKKKNRTLLVQVL